MKKWFALLLVLLVLSLLFSLARAEEKENVVQMPYTVQMPDVTREGLYTGETLNGVPSGFGLFTAVNADGVSWHYSGQWEDGEMNGQGGLYWDTGSCEVGTFQDNLLACGYIHDNPSQNVWIDYQKNDHGCYEAKEYRADGTVCFDGCISAETGLYHKGSIYTKDGKVFFSGEMGEGFDWSLILVD